MGVGVASSGENCRDKGRGDKGAASTLAAPTEGAPPCSSPGLSPDLLGEDRDTRQTNRSCWKSAL